MGGLEDSFVNKFYQCAVDSSSTCLIGVDNEERIIMYNSAAEAIMGISADEIIGQPLTKLVMEIGNGDSILLSTIRNGNEYEHVEAVIHSCAGPITVLAYTHLVRDEGGSIIGAVLAMRDITSQKQLEEKIYQNQKFTAIGELAAGIAHEVRNPLTSVKGFLQLFEKNTNIEDPNRNYLETMLKEIERVTDIINQFLLLARPVLPIKKKVDLIDLIEEVILPFKTVFGLQNVEIETIFDSSMPLVSLDRQQIKQALMNIVQNAIYAMPMGGKLTIETLYENIQNKVHIIIKDSGVGIDETTLNKIFNPFFTTKAERTGLGLTIAHIIVENHEGIIEVQSEPEQGSTFRILIPSE